MPAKRAAAASLKNEYATLDLDDPRRNARAQSLIVALAANPSVGFPKALNPAELEGLYRFIRNQRVSFAELLAAHRDATLGRAEALSRYFVAHDTTTLRFSDEHPREGLGRIDKGGQGFFAHFSLAIAPNSQALGVVACEPWARGREKPKKKASQRERYAAADKESLRWLRGVDAAGHGRADQQVIHLMDREADDYDILAGLVARRCSFVVRGATDRCLSDEPAKLADVLARLDVACMRDATLGSRTKNRPAKDRKKFPPRSTRTATLSFASAIVRIRRPDRASRDLPAELELNVVHVREIDPPAGEAPVMWTLYTSLPVATPTEMVEVADAYRHRWVVEEFFKALKTGCSFEKRQQESLETLLNVLALLVPVAWSLLNLRTLSRDPEWSSRPAEQVLTDTQLKILRAKSGGKLKARPTIREALLLMAVFFGGHIRNNGEPGWQVLGRAYEDLLIAEVGWRLAMASLEK